MPKKLNLFTSLKVTIEGHGRRVGTSTLAHLIGTLLDKLGHRVDIFDHGTFAPPVPKQRPHTSVASNFTEPRTIEIHVADNSIPDVPERVCVHCGCSDHNACEGGCTWAVEHKHTMTGVCSRCVDHTLAQFRRVLAGDIRPLYQKKSLTQIYSGLTAILKRKS